MKVKKIAVVHPLLGERLLTIDHAERLMSLRNTGGWEYKKEEEVKEVKAKKAKKD